jgi:hypothetical protein
MGVGRDEYITVEQTHGRFRQTKAASGRGLTLNWNRFRRPFHPDRNYREKKSTEKGRRQRKVVSREKKSPEKSSLQRKEVSREKKSPEKRSLQRKEVPREI